MASRLYLLLYEVAQLILIPVYVARLFLRSVCHRQNYLIGIHERFGFIRFNKKISTRIWIHAVSVGETKVALLLYPTLKKKYPDAQYHLSCNTPTAKQLLLQHQKIYRNDTVSYLPIDEMLISAFLFLRFKPSVYISVESELWPNHFNLLAQCDVPIILVNARLSEKSVVRWRKLKPLLRIIIQSVSSVLCRGKYDRARFASIGFPDNKLFELGNIKYDQSPMPITDTNKPSFLIRPLWIAASTHYPEEEMVARVYKQLQNTVKNIMLLLVPRHPYRAPSIRKMLEKNGFQVATRSLDELPNSSTDIYLCDTIGELAKWYHLADIAFIGGSLVPIGGHNPIEAIMGNCPIITGPHIQNFIEEYQSLVDAQAAVITQDEKSLTQVTNSYFNNPTLAKTQNKCAKQFLEEMRGSCDRTLNAIVPWLT